MENNNPLKNDFNNIDLIITNIENVYFSSTYNWARPTAFPRSSNGLVLFTEGSITYHFGTQNLFAKAGDMLIVPKDTIYSGKKTVGVRTSFYVVDFFTDPNTPLSNFSLPYVFTPSNFEMLESKFKSLLKVWQSFDPTKKLTAKSRLYSLISEIMQQYIKKPLETSNYSRAEKIFEYIDQNYWDANLSVVKLSKKFFISTSTLRRIFLSSQSKTPTEYITEVRIRNAKNMLAYDNLSINEISEKCGFASPHYFCRIFKKQTQKSPSQYKKDV